MSIENNSRIDQPIKDIYENQSPLEEGIMGLKIEIESGFSYEKINSIINQDITPENINKYLSAFISLVEYYGYKQNSPELINIGRQKIIPLIKILDTLIQIKRINESNINQQELYEKGDIKDLIGIVGKEITTLDSEALTIIERKLDEVLNQNSIQEQTIDNNDSLTDSDNQEFVMPKNWIQQMYEDLTGENLSYFNI